MLHVIGRRGVHRQEKYSKIQIRCVWEVGRVEVGRAQRLYGKPVELCLFGVPV